MKKLLLFSLSTALILSGCSAQPAKAVPNNQAALTTTKPAYYLSGKIQAASAADLSAAFTGRIEDLPFNVGDTVKAGESLVIFESSDAAAGAQITQAAYDAALANLAKAKTGARPEQIHQAEANLEAAKSTWENAKNTLERNQVLYEAQTVSAAQLEAVEGQAALAEAQYKSAQEQLAILKNGETKAYLAVLEKQVEQAKAAVNASQTSLGNRTLKAPFDGTIVACHSKTGETYGAQTVLVSLENRDRLTIDAYGPATAVQRFESGQPVTIRIAEVPDKTFTGTVTWVSDTIDPKRRAVLVKVSLDPSADLMAGMFAEIGLGQ